MLNNNSSGVHSHGKFDTSAVDNANSEILAALGNGKLLFQLRKPVSPSKSICC